MKEVLLPMKGSFVCGHGWGFGDLMIGREERREAVEGKNATYVAYPEFTSCSHCNKIIEDEIKEEAKYLDRNLPKNKGWLKKIEKNKYVLTQEGQMALWKHSRGRDE